MKIAEMNEINFEKNPIFRNFVRIVVRGAQGLYLMLMDCLFLFPILTSQIPRKGG